MLKITKKRFTDAEASAIKDWFASVGVTSSWADIYMYSHSVSNVAIVKHLVYLYNHRHCTAIVPDCYKGLKNVIIIDDDADSIFILRDFYNSLLLNRGKQYDFVQVVGLSGKLYSRNYHHVMGNHNYDGYKVVRYDIMCNSTLRIIINDLVAYKLRTYVLTGPNKGNLKNEEFFADKNAMDKRARELFNSALYGYNATAWELGADGEYTRLLGY